MNGFPLKVLCTNSNYVICTITFPLFANGFILFMWAQSSANTSDLQKKGKRTKKWNNGIETHLGITLTPSKRLFKEHRSRRLRKALLAVATIEYLREIQSKTTLAICYSKVVAYASYALPTIWAYLPISNDTNAIVVSLIPSSSRAFTSLLGTDCLLAF